MNFEKKSKLAVAAMFFIAALLVIGAGISEVYARSAPTPSQSPAAVRNPTQRGFVTVAGAHEIAVAMVGGGSVLETGIGFYLGTQVYQIDVEYSESRYRVFVAVNGGAVVRFEQRTSSSTELATTPAPHTQISQSEAVEIAIAHLVELGAPQGDLAYALRILREGRMVWDIEFRRGYFEYEFLIDAVTGEIADFEIEENSRYHEPQTPATTPIPATPGTSPHAPAPTQRPNQNPQHPMTFSYNSAIDVALELVGGGTVTVATLGFYQGSSVYQLTVEYSGSRFQIFINTADGAVERFRAR